MPGWSLWLMPPSASIVERRIRKAITETVPALFPNLIPLVKFAPHITLTSFITPTDAMISAPQKWLDDLPIDLAEPVHVNFESLQAEPKFFKKLFIRCRKDKGLLRLCLLCRTFGVEGGDSKKAEKFIEGEYDPHCSLMYSEAEVTPQMLSHVQQNLDGIAILPTTAGSSAPAPTAAAEQQQGGDDRLATTTGWSGGRIWLVPTDKAIEEWEAVAERIL